MKNLATRLSLLAAALLVCVVPVVGLPQGGGDTGVWILPRSCFLSSGLPSAIQAYQSGVLTESAPRSEVRLDDLGSALPMRVSAEVAVPPVAHLVDPVSALPFPVQVSGGVVTLPVRTMEAIAASPSGVGVGLIVDRRGQGYTIVARFDPQRESMTVSIY